MDSLSSLSRIYQALVIFNQTLDASGLFPTMIPEAAPLVVKDPYAFAIAACLDRGTKADIIWTIPYCMKEVLGHLDPFRIYQMTREELADLVSRLAYRPRYTSAAPNTIKDLTRIVVEECGGDASKIWAGKRAAEVKRTLISIYGVGEGIANMTVLLIESAFPVRFEDLDRPSMDIKPDVHTMRVLYRLGVSQAVSEQSAIEAARTISPHFPGEIDGVLWETGRTFCRPSDPQCSRCPLDEVCGKVGLAPSSAF
jgi:endonuclease III